MKILITGGAGFIGSNLASEFQSKIAANDVIILDDLSSGNENNIEDFKGEFITGKIEDEDFIKKLAGKNIEAIFHQAAITDTTVKDRDLMMGVNVSGLKHILLLAQKEKAVVVYASSAGVYGNGDIPMKEDQELLPHNLYAESKIEADKLAVGFSKETSLPVMGLRYFNVYGPRESYKNIAASMILQLSRQMKGGKNPRIFKHGEQARDFIYVKDIVAANLKAMEARKSGVVNVGTGKMTTFNRMIEILNEVLGTSYPPEYFDNPYGFYQDYTQADTVLAKELIGFEAKYSIEEGIKEYIKN